MDSVIIPTNIGSWPRVKKMLPEQKLIYICLWANPSTSSSGAYFIDLQMFSAYCGFDLTVLNEAISDFVQRDLITFDYDTSEVFINDWWRFHKCESGRQILIVNRSINKIESRLIRDAFFDRIKHVTNKINVLPSNTNITESKTNSKITTSTTEGIISVGSCGKDLIFNKKIHPFVIKQMKDELQNIDFERAQEMLDVMSAEIDNIKHPLSYLRKLIEKLKVGCFDPSRGFLIADKRNEGAKIQLAVNNSKNRKIEKDDDASEIGKKMIENCRKRRV